jgi:hypothetical protein
MVLPPSVYLPNIPASRITPFDCQFTPDLDLVEIRKGIEYVKEKL